MFAIFCNWFNSVRPVCNREMCDWFRALLRGDWSEAVELIMKPREGGQFHLFVRSYEIHYVVFKSDKNSGIAAKKLK